MEDKTTTLKVPEAYMPLVEDIRLLTTDQNNPNRMTVKQQEQVWHSLQKYGWAYPIITNKDGVYADGEQRAKYASSTANSMPQFFVCPLLTLTGECLGKSSTSSKANTTKS